MGLPSSKCPWRVRQETQKVLLCRRETLTPPVGEMQAPLDIIKQKTATKKKKIETHEYFFQNYISVIAESMSVIRQYHQ